MKKWAWVFVIPILFISCVPKLKSPPDLDIDAPQNWTSQREKALQTAVDQARAASDLAQTRYARG